MVRGNRVKRFRIDQAVVLALLVFCAAVAQAQTMTKPKEFYFDQDASTVRKIEVAQGEGEALAAELVKMRERGRRSIEATAQLAHIALADKRVELGKTLYEQAVSSTALNSSMGRAVRWNYAWDLYRNADYAQAFGLWNELAAGFGNSTWVPPTMALSLWSLDRKAEAVQWYAAAVRTEPGQWGDPANYPALLPQWREQDRARLAEVLAAWQASPPAWP